MSEKMCAAFARLEVDAPFQHVTLGGQIFMTTRGLMEDFVTASRAKHPEWEFEIREVEDA